MGRARRERIQAVPNLVSVPDADSAPGAARSVRASVQTRPTGALPLLRLGLETVVARHCWNRRHGNGANR